MALVQIIAILENVSVAEVTEEKYAS